MKIKFKSKGFRELLTVYSQPVIDDACSDIATEAGNHYGFSSKVVGDRHMGIVFTNDLWAIRDNAKNNTLLFALKGR